MKLKFFGLIIVSFMLFGVANAIPYKWASTTPITYVDISNIQDIEKLEYYLNSDNIVVIYTGNDFTMTSKTEELLEYIGLVESKDLSGKIPYFGDSVFITQSTSVIPKNYVYRDEDGAYIYVDTSMGETNKSIIFEASISSKIYDDGYYEIKPRKLFIPYNIDLENQDIIDFIGKYAASQGETFAYINKVPSNYDSVVINGIVVQNIIPDENGENSISVADRKITVEVRDEDLIKRKLNSVKTVSELLGIGTTYISTGSENIDIIKDSSITEDEKEDLLNSYWFKKRYSDYYTHIKYNDYGEYPNTVDLLAMSYYPLIYVDKAPETFEDDPTGGYYPNTISYSGSESLGYWNEGADSENNYYHYDGEDYWNDDETVSRDYWSVNGDYASMSEEIDLNDRYDYFEHWYVKNYAYAMTTGANGLLLFSSDDDLLDAVFNKYNKNVTWKLNIEGIDYLVIPDYIGYDKMNGVSVINVPGLNNNEINGIHFIEEIYIEPYDEEYGVYVADVFEYDTNTIYDLNDENTWICSFEEYADWAETYRTSKLIIQNDTVYLNADDNAKITIYRENITRVKGTSTELYDATGKLIISKAPDTISLNS
ncbi:hypothetical protein [Methanococcus maripaludis]|uniref:Uncharacterized protein n=2 Tax=Methanococcus maripaludis TaxID=39152 RepID=A0A7J9PEP1_METMI|nr:hypothetical protein [Methanococcus maripaludis]MBA2861725.1 hypothetical protein [Methanococcus maripaludis]